MKGKKGMFKEMKWKYVEGLSIDEEMKKIKII